MPVISAVQAANCFHCTTSSGDKQLDSGGLEAFLIASLVELEFAAIEL
jgi:hypothetical protein